MEMVGKTKETGPLGAERTASMASDCYCLACRWPIVFACCNGKMGYLHPHEDYWMYCSNQGCEHHVGEPYAPSGGKSGEPSFMCSVE